MVCLNRFELLLVVDLVLSNLVFWLYPDIFSLIKHLLGQLHTISATRGTTRVDGQLSHFAETTLKLAPVLHVSA